MFKKLSIGLFIFTLAFLGVIFVSASTILSSDKNLLVDGNMEKSGTTNWSGSQSVVSKQTTSPHSGKQLIRVDYDGSHGVGAALYNTVSFNPGTYRARGWARSDGTSIPNIYINTIGNGYVWTGTTSTNWQYFDVTFTWSGAAQNFQILSANLSAGHYIEADDVTLTLQSNSKITDGDKNLLVDGNMETAGTSTWPAAYGGSTSKQTTGFHSGKQSLRLVCGAPPYSGAIPTVALTVGRKYQTRGWYRCDGTAVASIANNADLGYSTTSSLWQYFNYEFTANVTGISVWTIGATSTWCEFDDIIVTAIPNSKITDISKNILVDGNMEKSTTSSWSVGAGTLTKSNTSPHDGKQAIRITSAGGLAYFQQAILTVGLSYRYRGYARGDGTNAPLVYAGTGAQSWSGTSSGSWQYFDQTNVAVQNRIAFGVGSTGYTEFDDVTITLVN
jgi:hypothetical protein